MAQFPTVWRMLPLVLMTPRTILLRDLEAIAREVSENGEGSTRRRRGQGFAVNLAVRAVDILNATTGGNGLAMSNPVQRAWRDVNAVAPPRFAQLG